jgi:3'(2'), 5'-bisphosphate nucleotidase
MNWNNQLQAALKAGEIASKEIMNIYSQDFDVVIKEDNSPVTIADQKADKIIRKYLARQYPNYAFLTEESKDDFSRLTNEYVWIVDPIDGTKDFINKNGEFTVNIALVYKHRVVVGVVIAPAINEVFYATKNGGSFWITKQGSKKIVVNNKTNDLTVLTSRFHFNENEKNIIDKHRDKIVKRLTYGSSLKPCYIAAGLAEISYRLSSGTKEWDTAASQLIVEEAEGYFLKPDKSEITYNRQDVYNRQGYLIVNRLENFLL